MAIHTDDFIPARWFYQGRARKVRLGVLHATQSPERERAARGVARDFATRIAANKASAHVVIDNREVIGCVAAGDTAFAVPNANADGFHIEQVGYSEQSEIDWLDTYSQDVIELAASCARQASAMFALPLVWLSVDEVRGGKAGWTDHATCSKALGGTHWDPGPNYPREQFMALLRMDPTPPPTEEDDNVLHLVQGDKKPEWWVTDLIGKRYVGSADEAARIIVRTLSNGGKIEHGPNNGPVVWPQADVDAIKG